MLDYDDQETYILLLQACKRFGVDPSMSVESENFFRKLLAQYHGEASHGSILAWLDQQIAQHFLALNDRPNWIQSPEWPFADERPMIFAGQIDVTVEHGGMPSQLFHDDTSLYVFLALGKPPVVVLQQY